MAKKATMMEKVGSWAFIIGVVIAILIGIFSFGAFDVTLVSVLIVLGIIVGLLNVTSHESSGFLLAAVSLVIVSRFGGDIFLPVAVIGPVLTSVMNALMTFVIPAAIIVALKAIYQLAQDN